MNRELVPFGMGSGAHLLEDLRSRMDLLLDNFLSDTPAFSTRRSWERAYPALNLWEDEKNLFAECEIPGLRMEDIDVSVAGNELYIRGELRDPEIENATYHRREYGPGSFVRSVRLPVDIDGDKVSAELSDGILTITMPKAKAATVRKIKVKNSK